MSITLEHRGARRRSSLRTTLAIASTLVVGLGASAALATSANAEDLTGEITLTSGATSGSTPYAGSWVRLYLDGTPAALYTNPASPASDKTYTPLVNGTTGLDLDNAQPGALLPADHFDPLTDDSLDDEIISPRLFGAKTFGVYTTSAPTLEVDDNSTDPTQTVSGTVGGWTVSYDTVHYPTGGSVTGTVTWDDPYDHSQGGHVKLNWTSDITNGPFSPYTADWQVEGRLN